MPTTRWVTSPPKVSAMRPPHSRTRALVPKLLDLFVCVCCSSPFWGRGGGGIREYVIYAYYTHKLPQPPPPSFSGLTFICWLLFVQALQTRSHNSPSVCKIRGLGSPTNNPSACPLGLFLHWNRWVSHILRGMKLKPGNPSMLNSKNHISVPNRPVPSPQIHRNVHSLITDWKPALRPTSRKGSGSLCGVRILKYLSSKNDSCFLLNTENKDCVLAPGASSSLQLYRRKNIFPEA